jgi:hypothetical protein
VAGDGALTFDCEENQAPEAYRNFDARNDGLTKVVLKPGS